MDVLWHASKGVQQRATLTAFERDWHRHIQETVDERTGVGLSPVHARHLILLMGMVDWSNEAQDEDSTNSAIPDALYQALDQERWIMLQNALIDWDIIGKSHRPAKSDALMRLAVVYLLPVFEGAPAELDSALGGLLTEGSSALPMCESPGAVERYGRRWREDLCTTAWHLVLEHHQG